MSNIVLCQVCPFEEAKKLEELGVVQESAFYWICEESWKLFYFEEMYDEVLTIREAINSTICDVKAVSAYTVAELGAMLSDMDVGAQMDMSARRLANTIKVFIGIQREDYSIEKVNQRLRMFHEGVTA
jgi:hypothetical protein